MLQIKPTAGRDELPFDANCARHIFLTDDHIIAINSGLNEYGECSFTLYWWADYTPGHPDGEHVPRWRAQGYYAKPNRYIVDATDYNPKKGLVLKSKKLWLPAKLTRPALRAKIKKRLAETHAHFVPRNPRHKFLLVAGLPVVDELMRVVMAMSDDEFDEKGWWFAGISEEENLSLCRFRGAHRGLQRLAREIATEVYEELSKKGRTKS